MFTILVPASKLTRPVGPPEPLLIPSNSHCTPSSRTLSLEISAITASTITWARGTSSLPTTARRVRNCSGGAVMTRELVPSSAWMLTLSPEGGAALPFSATLDSAWLTPVRDAGKGNSP